VTLAEGAPKVLRGATWYKLVPGMRSRTRTSSRRAKQQLQVETAPGSIVNVTGEATIVVSLAKAAPSR
jgi:hypothetical protein